ncbi:MAG: TetR/AcrR family transcriptional regulator [Bacteroidales bacterium]|jgi:AcrR family transcriptional regulator|nr:TetR/AcrR family transcriptional regulator [Bacteroidales bacterium]MDD4673774.1 TetR/AcrR family transcriptional regulator [Bacteroidales bacterium]MDY0349139.1 TetR/AcrR family transcriptional regulator [Tenuifilaceae bacterium]
MEQFKNNKKYQDTIRTAKELFWKYGIKRVTIEEICKEASVSKMTFYKFFKNKTELAKTILENLVQSSLLDFDKLIKSELPFPQKLERIFLMKIEGMNNFSMEFIRDIYTNPNLDLKEFMEQKKNESKDSIINFYKDAQNQGFIRNDVKIDFLLSYADQIVKMMENENLMAQYDKPQDFIIEAMNALFYGIVKKSDK